VACCGGPVGFGRPLGCYGALRPVSAFDPWRTFWPAPDKTSSCGALICLLRNQSGHLAKATDFYGLWKWAEGIARTGVVSGEGAKASTFDIMATIKRRASASSCPAGVSDE